MESLGKALIPPGVTPTLAWRLTMSITLASVLIWIMWAMSAFAGIGFAGFARADQQSEVLAELEAQKVERLESQILQFQRDLCAAEPGSRPRAFYLGERNKRMNVYRQVTGQMYQGLPSCGEL